MNNNNQIPQCPHCQSTLIEKNKEGRIFFVCPNWKPNGSGCEGYLWSPQTKGRTKPQQTTNQVPQLLEEINTLKHGQGVIRGDIKRIEDLIKNIEIQVIGRKVYEEQKSPIK